MHRVLKTAAATVIALGLVACESTGTVMSDEDAINAALDRLNVVRGSAVNNVPNFRMTGWQAINSRTLVVTARLHNHYLVTLVTSCLDLPYAFSIGLDTRTSALSRGDYIVVNSLQRPRERCPIREITPLVDRE